MYILLAMAIIVAAVGCGALLLIAFGLTLDFVRDTVRDRSADASHVLLFTCAVFIYLFLFFEADMAYSHFILKLPQNALKIPPHMLIDISIMLAIISGVFVYEAWVQGKLDKIVGHFSDLTKKFRAQKDQTK